MNAYDDTYHHKYVATFGDYTSGLTNQVLRSYKHDEQAYNSCAEILHSFQGIPHRIVQKASRNATKYMPINIHTLNKVTKIL